MMRDLDKVAPLGPQVPIEAERFVLRAPDRSDGGLIERYMDDPRVAQMTRNVPSPLPPGYVDGLIRNAAQPDRDTDYWVIDGTAQGHAEVMGLMKMTRMDRNQSEIRYWVAPAFWNTGIATHAVETILKANPQGACDIYAEVFQDNPGSARVLSNAGFTYLGDAEAFSVARNAVAPTWTYARKMGT